MLSLPILVPCTVVASDMLHSLHVHRGREFTRGMPVMRVLITTQPESGHRHPLVPLARALNTAGHDVAFASTPAGSSAIAANSFRCFSLGTDSTQEELAAQGERLGTLLPGDRVAAFWAEIFAGTRATRVLPDLLAVCHEWHPTLFVREYMEFAGCVAAERMGLAPCGSPKFRRGARGCNRCWPRHSTGCVTSSTCRPTRIWRCHTAT